MNRISSRRVIPTLLIAAALVVGTAAAPAVAAMVPLRAETVSGPALQDAAFAGVACPAVASCIGVGNYMTPDGTALPMAQVWDGSTWSAQSAPTPTGAREGYLSAISCASVDDCLAAGHAVLRDGRQAALAERWNGSSWSIEALPNTASPTRLQGVSCPTPTFCAAVGRIARDSGTAPLTEVWKNGVWRVAAQVQIGHTVNSLEAVSCASATDCLAVGDTEADWTFNGGGGRSIAAHWDGGYWYHVGVVTPTDGVGDHLLGVACPAVHSCVAVGGDETGPGGSRSLVESWHGSRLRTSATGADESVLRAVVCQSTSACMLVGSSGMSSTIHATTSAVQWDGARLIPTATPGGPNSVTTYAGLACVSAQSCLAVGQSDSYGFEGQPAAPVAATWDGAVWSATNPLTFPTVTGHLTGVSCWAVAACLAVGGNRVYRRTASGWMQGKPLPTPASGGAITLAALSCPTAAMCMAVGTLYSNGQHAYAARHTASGWRLAVPPSGDPLTAVSCVSATSCVAVGAGSDESQAQTWSGSTWTLATLPAAFSPTHVSCSSVTACTAVGTRYTDNFSFFTYSVVVRLDGTTWTRQADAIADDNFGRTDGVSCPTATFCMATSNHTYDSDAITQVWNGTSWTIVPIVVPVGATHVDPGAVSCTSPTACTMVGSAYSSNGTSAMLRERWDGTRWTRAAATDPNIAKGPTVADLDCVTATGCAAVGTTAGPGDDNTAFAPMAATTFG